ncbi:MAG: preprotein translocase subunit SecY [Myxococcales bacterium]|nr:MAG: preprotein translocase subunit SecY [Myxococcales bacterium]
MATNFVNIARVPELKRRILFTLAMLAVFRLGIYVSSPGVDRNVMMEFMGQAGGLFGLFNMFTGGAMRQVSVFALGIMPYISSSIIFQLLTVVWPYMHQLRKEGEAGRRKINQYTRYGTVVLSVLQSFGIAMWLESVKVGEMVVVDPDMAGWGFRLLTVVSMTAGTAFLMWLGEQITEKGIGNGISLIIFSGIVAGLPAAIKQTIDYVAGDQITPLALVAFLVLMIVTIGAIIFVERGQRRIPVQYAKRVVGRKVYGGQSTHLPLKVNTSGVIPPIFASSIIMFPATMANFIDHPWMNAFKDAMNPGNWVYNALYVVLIVFFAFFYTAVQFDPMDVADNMKKYGGFIPGIRPGKKTAEFIDTVLTRITVLGAIYLAVICVMPMILQEQMNVPFYFGGTALLIAVGVSLDTVAQIESHLITRHYDGLTGAKGPRIRGRQTIRGR